MGSGCLYHMIKEHVIRLELWLRGWEALAALLEDWDWIPSTHMALRAICNSRASESINGS